ncbi:MAG: GNAT family N-acetyltransferase [Thiomonas sp.]|uniref:Putative Acyl-CoA N-acyltransferase n=1 Tax=mine drainage metagenome TaxID=410659 RepID=E6PMW3_9ZZZZ
MQTAPHTSPSSTMADAPDFPLGPVVSAWKPPPSPAHTPLAGLRARLEPLDMADHAVSLHAANAEDSAGRMWTYLPYGPFADAAAYADWVRESQASRDPLFFAIVAAATGQASGVAAYLRIDPNNGCIEIGHLAFAPRLQRTPAATEALFLMLDHAFALGYRRVEWKCNALNAPSRRAAPRLGFSFEGLFRQAAVVKGRNRDTAWYAMLDREWPALRRAYVQWLDAANFDAQGRQRQALGTLTQPALASSHPAAAQV